MKILKKVLDILFDLVIAVIVILAAVISISTFTSKANNGVASFLGYSTFSIQTSSMEPTISVGDYIFVEECDADNMQVGDIISFFTLIEGQREVNTHRIISIVEENGFKYYETQGDNNEIPDRKLVDPGDVIGQYNNLKITGFGKIMDFLKTQKGFFLVVLLPVLLFTVFQTYKLIVTVNYNKKIEMLEAAESATEDQKDAIIAEYLAKQKEAEEAEKAAEAQKEADKEAEKEAIIAEYLAKQKLEEDAKKTESTDNTPNGSDAGDGDETGSSTAGEEKTDDGDSAESKAESDNDNSKVEG